jgi:hypothetical protein
VKLVVPYIGELRDLDARMVRLAEFLGISCETLILANVAEHAEFLEKTVPDQCSCLVVNPQVMKEWVGLSGIPDDLVAFLLSRFSHLLVHGLRVDPFDIAMVAALSRGKLKSVDAIDGLSPSYVVAKDSKNVCEAFSGLSFGPVNPVNDHVFCTSGGDPAVQQLISIGGRPLMAAVRLEGTEILFVASEDVVDLKAELADAPLAQYFSRLLPHAMALRHVAGDQCWRPCEAHASIIIDDPLLRNNYGFLNFQSLLALMEQHNFHTTIAFIPHNFRRTTSQVTRMFLENASRLSICYHGNDHTGEEFASTDTTLLNTLIHIAEHRMRVLYKTTGLPCDKVMVFPQENFSEEALATIKSHNFHAAVNSTPRPRLTTVYPTIGEVSQPAVLRYGGFPIFVRRLIQTIESQDIAFNLFFGRPVLVFGHHEIFQDPELVVEIATRINAIASEVHWSSLATAVSNSILKRKAPDGTHHIRAYSGTVRVSNGSGSVGRFSIEWDDSCNSASVEQILMDGALCPGFEVTDAGIRLSLELAPGSSQTFSLVHRNPHATVRSLGLRRNARAFLRRRLSEVRDKYLSRNRENRMLEWVVCLTRRII